MPDPIPCPELVRIAGAFADVARQDPDQPVLLVAAQGPVVFSASRAGQILLAHGWCPAQSAPPARLAATMAAAAVRLERTVAPPALARWS